MTTLLTERGSHIDSGETFSDRQGYLDALTFKGITDRLGALSLDETIPMDEDHPFYDDWKEHVDAQPHQGC